MSGNILVGYATRTGSTREVAEAIAGVMRERGLVVDLKPLREVRSLEGYPAAVIGAPLYFGRLLGDGRRFLSRQQKALAGVPVALFTLGAATTKPEEQQGAQDMFDAELARFPWLHPVATACFGGRWDPGLLRFPFSLLKKALQSQPTNDARDWDAIRTWAGELVGLLGVSA